MNLRRYGLKTDKVANLSAELIRKKDQQEIDKKAKKDLAERRNEQMQSSRKTLSKQASKKDMCAMPRSRWKGERGVQR